MKIQIDSKLFFQMADVIEHLSFACTGDTDKILLLQLDASEILTEINCKKESIQKRIAYTQYKTARGTEREKARIQYLDVANISDSYRTDEEYNPWAVSDAQAEQAELDEMLTVDEMPDIPLDLGYWE